VRRDRLGRDARVLRAVQAQAVLQAAKLPVGALTLLGERFTRVSLL